MKKGRLIVVSGFSGAGKGTVIKRLREKIKDHEKWKIATIWGIGYKFESV